MNLTADNYYSREANQQYMSVSQFKSFLKCPAAALAELHGEIEHEPSESMLIGSYVDSYFSNEMERFKAENPSIFKKDGTLLAKYVKAEKIIHRIKQDEMFMSFLDGEKQTILTGSIEDIPFKVKCDALHSDKIVDLKVMKDMGTIYDENECARVPFLEFYGYHIQAACYQSIVEQNTGKRLPFYLAVATKQDGCDIAIIEIVQSDIDRAMETVRQNIRLFDAMKQGVVDAPGCGDCPYCRQHKKLTEIIKSDSPLFM